MDSQTVVHSDASVPGHGMRLKAFLTTVMSLLSLFVFWLGCVRNDVLWSWLGFLCALVSGIFVQLFINRKKTTEGH